MKRETTQTSWGPVARRCAICVAASLLLHGSSLVVYGGSARAITGSHGTADAMAVRLASASYGGPGEPTLAAQPVPLRNRATLAKYSPRFGPLLPFPAI